MAYGDARRAGLAPPDWVLKYFDRSATRLAAFIAAPPRAGKIDAAIAKALGFKSGGKTGRKNPFESDIKNRVLAMWVALEKQYFGDDKMTIVYEEVAKSQGAKKTTVIEAWKKYGDLSSST